MDTSFVVDLLGTLCYIALALVALWGAYSVIFAWRSISMARFRSEESQEAFLGELDDKLRTGDFDAAAELCDGDERAMPKLVVMALSHRSMGYAKLRAYVVDRFQRDVLADIEHRVSWVNTVIKSAPMLGLFGTVLGMMGAFAKIAAGDKVDTTLLAQDISLALITTALGLAIAIPLTLCTTSLAARIRQLEDLVGVGLTRLFESLRPQLAEQPAEGK